MEFFKTIYNKINDMLIIASCDKFIHFFYGLILTLIIYPISGFYLGPMEAILSTISFILLIAIIKEVMDGIDREYHTPEISDVFFTVLPSMLVFIIVFVTLLIDKR